MIILASLIKMLVLLTHDRKLTTLDQLGRASRNLQEGVRLVTLGEKVGSMDGIENTAKTGRI